MKNSVVKKLMAYVLVGAMTISTPITAAAAENSVIANAYSDNQEADGSGSGSGSKSKSKSGSLPEDVEKTFELNAMGLALDSSELNLDKDETGRLQARVLFADYNPEDEVMVLAVENEQRELINKCLKWQISDEAVVSVANYTDTNNKVDNSIANVTALAGGTAYVTAYLDENGNNVIDEGEYSATAVVNVTEYITDAKQMKLELPEQLYVKHTYNLNNFMIIPATAKNDKITYYVSGDYAKAATVTSAGVLNIKKNAGSEITINAVTSKGIKLSETVKVADGTAAKKATVANNKLTLDLGIAKERTTDIEVKLDPSNSTDAIYSWTVKDSKIATVVGAKQEGKAVKAEDTLTATIKAVGVGKTTVTAVTTAGKKVNINVTVNATPDRIALSYAGSEKEATIYTGKKPQLSVVSYAEDGIVIPNGKTKYTWTATATGFEKNKKATVKDGKVTPHYILADENGTGIVTVNASVKKTTLSADFTLNVKQVYSEEKSGKLFGADGTEIAVTDKTTTVYVGKPVKYTAKSTVKSAVVPENLSDIFDWSAKKATVSDTGLVNATEGGKVNLNLSYVVKDSKGKLKLETKKWTLVSKQNATKFEFKSDVLAVEAGSKAAAKATIQIKQQLPKKANDTITWKVLAAGETNVGSHTVPYDKKNANDKKLVLDLSSYKAGTVVKVGAYGNSGTVAYAYIYVVDKTGAPAVANKKVDLKVGATVTLATNPTLNPLNKAYENEPVRYSVDAKSAAYVSIAADGTVYGVAPGKAKVTVTSASGKKTTVNVTVTE